MNPSMLDSADRPTVRRAGVAGATARAGDGGIGGRRLRGLGVRALALPLAFGITLGGAACSRVGDPSARTGDRDEPISSSPAGTAARSPASAANPAASASSPDHGPGRAPGTAGALSTTKDSRGDALAHATSAPGTTSAAGTASAAGSAAAAGAAPTENAAGEIARVPSPTVVRASPRNDAPIIGVLGRRAWFHVQEEVEGGACRRSRKPGRWVRLERGYACIGGEEPDGGASESDEAKALEADAQGDETDDLGDANEAEVAVASGSPRAAAAPGTPQVLPILRAGEDVPFYYLESRITPETPVTASGGKPRWRSLGALLSGAPPDSVLPAPARYAFVRKLRRGAHGVIYIDEQGRAVTADGLRKLTPSAFVGRDLEASPVPAGLSLAWVVSRDTPLLDAPKSRKPPVGSLAYHAELYVRETLTETKGFVEVVDADGQSRGFVQRNKIRVALVVPALPPPEGAASSAASTSPTSANAPSNTDAQWVDIDTNEQVLTLMRGDRPVFTTLVSTGKPGDRTPPGIFQIRLKHAWGTMRSLPGADDPYRVEGVPWAAYFFQRYALHGVYWHNSFGRVASHGCVNLAPRDAALVFAALAPELPEGYVSIHADAQHPGAVVRVRTRGKSTPDHRRAGQLPADDATGDGFEAPVADDEG